MATVFATGGAGFIGSHFVRDWLARYPDDTVINYDLLTYVGNPDSLADVARQHADRYRFIRDDINDYATLVPLFRQLRPEYVINFAAESHNSRAVLDPGLFYQTNVMGTQRLLQAARDAGVPRFHHISTCEVSGDMPLEATAGFTETSPYRPRTPHNVSKAAADHAVRAYVETFGLPATISVCSNKALPVSREAHPDFTIKAIQGEKMPLYESS